MIVLTELEEKMRQHLMNFAKIGDNNKSFVRYKPLAEAFNLPFENEYERSILYLHLGNISEYEVENGRPMLSVVVVNDEFVPGKGFYELAKKLNKQKPSEDNVTFAVNEHRILMKYWKNHG